VSPTPRSDADERLDALRDVLDSQTARYQKLRAVSSFGEYVHAKAERADEELLTEPILASIIERVLGFPPDAYFPQYGKGGQKPDFTPLDLIAHPFVLDAKASNLDLKSNEPQIRRYMRQRSLAYGVLFNLREFRVYRLNEQGPATRLSFSVLDLWKIARGEALDTGEQAKFMAFCEVFAYREVDVEAQKNHVRQQLPWSTRLTAGEDVLVDIEFLVEQLRLLSRMLAEDAAAQVEALDDFLRFGPGRVPKLLEELQVIALDIAPRTRLEELPPTIEGWRTGEGVASRAWRQYLLRVSYLALTRILLYRSWEDVDFVDSYLYDGGFEREYARLSNDVRRVLDEAFLHGSARYPWLYGRENNYDWYRPSERPLVEVLYRLAPIPLGKLDADVLGGLYQSYVEEIDRDRLGQFFTPRSVVRFMLDRAGFHGAEVFRVEGDERKPRRVLDFATGSGGFLVEAARRIVDEGGVDLDDAREIKEALLAITTGFVGGEISPFPYYLTEINLLLQVSRLLGALRRTGEAAPGFTLGVLHVDTLIAKSAPDRSLEVEPGLRADRSELVQDQRFDLVPLDGEKLETYRNRLRADGSFDLVVGNPPYVTEANNKPLFERLRAIPAWNGIYKGKTDYLYYFLLLAVEKLAPGGRLCVITPAGWMNAGQADFLRERLAAELRLDELFLFGSYRLFAPEEGVAPTPTVESAILVATKVEAPKRHRLRVVALESELDAARALARDSGLSTPSREALLDEMQKRAGGKPGRAGGIHVHGVLQANLVSKSPWPVKFGAKDVAPRVVAHLETLLQNPGAVVPLQADWQVFQGIQTGADAYSARIQKRLPPETRTQLAASGAETGDPILELPPGREDQAPWDAHRDVLARSIEPRAILYGAVDDADYSSLVWLGHGDEAPQAVRAELERWRPVLATRADLVANPSKPWWANHRARDKDDLRSPKVIALYRTDRGRFALDETGEWQPSIKTTLAVGRAKAAPVAYLCGLLNSELLDLWYAVRGKAPRDVWRNYEPKRMNEIPYRRPDDDASANRVSHLVRAIAANRRALLPHRAFVHDLGRIVKDPWKSGPVVVDRRKLIAGLKTNETVSVRLDSLLELTVSEPGSGRPRREAEALLVFRRGRKETARVAGDGERLDLLEEVVGERVPDDLGAVQLPKDLLAFEQRASEQSRVVGALLAEGRRLVEEVERLVCALYEVSDELTEEVVAHAVRRAEGPA